MKRSSGQGLRADGRDGSRPPGEGGRPWTIWRTTTREAFSAVLEGRETALDWSDGNAARLSDLAGLYETAIMA